MSEQDLFVLFNKTRKKKTKNEIQRVERSDALAPDELNENNMQWKCFQSKFLYFFSIFSFFYIFFCIDFHRYNILYFIAYRSNFLNQRRSKEGMKRKNTFMHINIIQLFYFHFRFVAIHFFFFVVCSFMFSINMHIFQSLCPLCSSYDEAIRN